MTEMAEYCDDCLHAPGWHHPGFGCEHPMPAGSPKDWCGCARFAYEREQVILV